MFCKDIVLCLAKCHFFFFEIWKVTFYHNPAIVIVMLMYCFRIPDIFIDSIQIITYRKKLKLNITYRKVWTTLENKCTDC